MTVDAGVSVDLGASVKCKASLDIMVVGEIGASACVFAVIQASVVIGITRKDGHYISSGTFTLNITRELSITCREADCSKK